jgi:hypothetical protein
LIEEFWFKLLLLALLLVGLFIGFEFTKYFKYIHKLRLICSTGFILIFWLLLLIPFFLRILVSFIGNDFLF